MSLKQIRTAALAATLLAGTTAFAYAQSSSPSTDSSHANPGESSSMRHSGAPSPSSGATGNRPDTTGSGDANNGGNNATMRKDQSTTGESSSPAPASKSKSGESTSGQGQMDKKSGQSTSGQAQTDKNAASKTEPQNKSTTSGTGTSNVEGGRNGANASSTNNRMNGASTQQGTSGRGSSSVNLTTQQKTEIRSTVIENKSAPRMTNVNFNVSVGTVVPTTVHFAPVPETLVRIHPGWRGFNYVVYNDEVIIIHPHTRRIVEIIVLS